MKRVAIALVALLALTGCAETGSLVEKAQIELGMQRLTQNLSELGIDTDYSAELTPDYNYVVYVTATGPELSEQQLAEVATVVRAELGAGVFATIAEKFERSGSSFTLSSQEGTVFAIDDYAATEEQLRADIAYAYALGNAYGAPPTLFIGPANATTEGGYTCSAGVRGVVAAPDWTAIRALGDSACGLILPGLMLDGRELDTELTDLVDALGAVAPLLQFTEAHEDSFVTVDAYSDSVFVSYSADEVDVADPTASPRWPTVVAIAHELRESGLPLTLYLYPSGGPESSSVAFGPCSEVSPVNDADAVVAAALTAALGAEVMPGMCVHA